MSDGPGSHRAAFALQSALLCGATLFLLLPATASVTPLTAACVALGVSLWPIRLRHGLRLGLVGSAVWLAWLCVDGSEAVAPSGWLWAAGALVVAAVLAWVFLNYPVPALLAGRAMPWLAGGMILLWVAGGELAAGIAMAPYPAPIERTDAFAPRVPEEVRFEAADEVATRGWLVVADPRRCVILLAGIRGNRTTNVERARFWLQRGWSVLLLDLRGTGASDESPITFGWKERLDVEAAWDGLVKRGFEAIAVHAISLGAAATCYAVRDGLSPHPSFVVLEQLYGDAREALSARLSFVPLPTLLLWPLVAAAEHRLGVAAEVLRPVDGLTALYAPVLLLQGRDDTKVGANSGEDLLQAAAVRPKFKRLVWLEGVGHVDLWRHARQPCESALTEFIDALPDFVPR